MAAAPNFHRTSQPPSSNRDVKSCATKTVRDLFISDRSDVRPGRVVWAQRRSTKHQAKYSAEEINGAVRRIGPDEVHTLVRDDDLTRFRSIVREQELTEDQLISLSRRF
jgi:hypothetical protein